MKDYDITPAVSDGEADLAEAYGYISKITGSRSIDEIKDHITSFLDFVAVNKKYSRRLCKRLLETIMMYSGPYMMDMPGERRRYIIVKPAIAPVFFMFTCVPVTTKTTLVINGLKRFVERCSEFGEPLTEAVTEDEIKQVLDIAQTEFRLLDIIAPNKALEIIRLNNSHNYYNCECGFSEDGEPVILVYHPREITVYDRVFIFAHELGHALHVSLTKNLEVLPDYFDKFNESLGVNLPALKAKQEAFADATAFAILNNGGLGEHIPVGPTSKEFAAVADKYIRYLTNKISSERAETIKKD